MANLEEKITNLIIEKLSVSKEQVKPDANFIEDLGADSLDLVQFVMELEDEFDIEIPDEESEKLVTVKDVIEYIESKAK